MFLPLCKGMKVGKLKKETPVKRPVPLGISCQVIAVFKYIELTCAGHLFSVSTNSDPVAYFVF